MNMRKMTLVLGLAAVAVVLGGSAVLYARQYAAGTIVPGKALIINKGAIEAVPVSIVAVESPFPPLQVSVLTTPATDLSERSLARLAPVRQVWEYSVIPVTDADVATKLNAAGRDGWELVSVLATGKGSSLLLKRLGR